MQCEHCGAEFEKSKEKQRFCTSVCRRGAERQRARDRGYVRPPYKPKHVFVCKHCGCEYKTAYKDRNTYCSRECAFKDKERRCACGVLLRGESSAQCEVCSQITIWREYKCGICGDMFYSERKRKHCSRDCELQYGRERSRVLFVSVAETNEYVAKKCLHCGSEFVVNYYAEKRKYCSEVCAKKAERLSKNHKARAKRYYERRKQRERKKGDRTRVYRAKIFERDGWRCQICGKKVNHELKWPHPKSATLDHIVPLSMGGEHLPHNCQLAHFICNSRKSDYGVFQPRLIG